jgi:hypothetical protein
MWPETTPKRFIVWGHEHYSHTHSYIHYGYFKAAQSLGWDVEWLKNTKENALKLGNTDEFLFFTEGQVDSYIPINAKSFYILHNCHMNKYKDIPEKNKLLLGVYVNYRILKNTIPLENKLFHYWQEDINTLYMPWATDILPDEIDENIKNLNRQNNGKVVFLGSCWGGYHGNIDELTNLSNGCKKINLPFDLIQTQKINQEESIKILQNAFITPSIVGRWQKEVGYIPCRIFKTISYGQLGVTNSKEAFEIINKLGVYNPNESELIKDSLEKVNDLELRKQAMEFVRDNHTYLNRIDTLQHIFKMKQNI